MIWSVVQTAPCHRALRPPMNSIRQACRKWNQQFHFSFARKRFWRKLARLLSKSRTKCTNCFGFYEQVPPAWSEHVQCEFPVNQSPVEIKIFHMSICPFNLKFTKSKELYLLSLFRNQRDVPVYAPMPLDQNCDFSARLDPRPPIKMLLPHGVQQTTQFKNETLTPRQVFHLSSNEKCLH